MSYGSIDDILSSALMNFTPEAIPVDQILKTTKFERRLYKELRDGNETLDTLETEGCSKLRSFKALMGDTFQSFYSLKPKFMDDDKLSAYARKFNKFLLSEMMDIREYPAIKSVCEGMELPAIEAAAEFIATLMPRLDELLKAASGEKNALETLEKLEKQRDDMLEKLSGLLEEYQKSGGEKLERRIISLANKAESKAGQAEMLGKIADRNLQKSKAGLKEILSLSLKNAQESAETVKNVLRAWGDGSGGEMKSNPANAELLKKVKESPRLLNIAKFLGRYREILCDRRKNSYAYGRGEKYDLEYGNSITKALTSELAQLSEPRLVPLFIRKYQTKRLKQYRKREAVYKGSGDIIVCLDQSGSTLGEKAAWGMATALVLLEICRINRRNFALVYFSDRVETDLFLPGDKNTEEHILKAAETFLGGDTDFEKPLNEALDLIEKGVLQKPDVVFITDGMCDISQDFETRLAETKRKYTITGILLDKGSCLEFSLEKFCDKIYRTSELCEDEITGSLISAHV